MLYHEKVANLANEALSSERHFLVDVVVSGKQDLGKVTVVVDGDQGVTIDDCAAVSRKLGKLLEDAGLAGDDFSLEVTTPGIDHPLKLKRQYGKNIGRVVKVQLKDKAVESGKLVSVHEESIELEREEKEGKAKTIRKIALPFAEIERTIVQVSFK